MSAPVQSRTPALGTPSAGTPAAAQAEPASSGYTPPVKVWAWVGAILVVVEAYFLIKWVAGPQFTPVESGPDEVPGVMKGAFLVGQIVLIPAMLLTMFHFVVRPWLRERRVSTDGWLCIAFLLAAPWDPLSNYGQTWFTYNSGLVNFGSVVGELPGVLGRHGPGVGEAWSIIAITTIYVTVFIWMAIFVCWLMRLAKRRYPKLGPVALVGICLAITMLADLLIEGIILQRFGFYNFAGGHWSLFPSHFYKYPLHEMVFGGAVFAMFCCLRYFTNDKGETLVERGSDKLRASPGRKNVIRGLAVIAAVHVGFLFCYHLPSGFMGINSTAWPEDTQNRSYFTNGVCGPEVNRACPGPATPNPRQDAPYLDFEGNLVPVQ